MGKLNKHQFHVEEIQEEGSSLFITQGFQKGQENCSGQEQLDSKCLEQLSSRYSASHLSLQARLWQSWEKSANLNVLFLLHSYSQLSETITKKEKFFFVTEPVAVNTVHGHFEKKG